MKTKIAFSLLLAAALSFLPVSASGASANSDCQFGISQLELEHGLFILSPGPGPFETWGDFGPVFGASLKLVGPNHYQLSNAQHKVQVDVIFDGQQASFHLSAPDLDLHRVILATQAPSDPSLPGQVFTAQVDAQTTNEAAGTGLAYNITCNFGLSDQVNTIENQEAQEMDKLGPPAEWSDPSAPSLATLAVGTVLELQQDLQILPGTDKERSYIVEQNGLMTETSFQALQLPFRFAYAQFFDANNLYLHPVTYPKGMKLVVTSISSHGFSDSPGQEFEIHFSTQNSEGISDPIVRMNLEGRRDGSSDLKLPEFIEMMKPVFKIL